MLKKLHLGLASILGIGSAIASFDCAIAQVVPDATLGAESSVVTQTSGSIVDLIQGGATRDANLFHSFEQFSVLTGREARFDNALDIQNIISRVTGASISNIDGFIRSNGTANLFLINPNGIIFSPNASLTIGGSFVGSTASSVNFADGTVFSATAPQPTPLLTVSVPVGLQFGETRGSIVNQSRLSNSRGVGLRVGTGETLALVGGNVSLNGGELRTQGGRVELAGVAEPATVGLNIDSNNLRLSFAEGVRLSDVSLTNGAVVNVSAVNSGSIAVTAGNITISGGSSLRANRQRGSGSVNTQTGDITLNATEVITVTNDNSRIFSNVLDEAVGNGGSINITTGSLLVNDGGRLEFDTLGQGDAGNVTINARDRVSLDGEGVEPSGIFSRVQSEGVGRGGDINVTAGSLSISDGARLNANTAGQGNAGNVTINVHNTISLDRAGTDVDTADTSGISSRVTAEGVGNGGNINVTTGSLFATNGARLNANTSGVGNAGNVTILARDTVSLEGVVGNQSRSSGGIFSRVDATGVGRGGDINVRAGSLFATNGARLSAESLGQGSAGDITINARDSVFLDGVGSNGNSSGIVGAVSIPRDDSSINASSPGQGGNLTIKTGQLIVRNDAEVNVTSERLGSAGEIRVEADSIELSDGGNIKAEALLSQGGNIDLQVRDVILMRRQGLISATAGGTGNGGNVTIGNATNAPLVVAFPAENSDIIAQADAGQGGRIRIFTQGIFGLEVRNPTTPQSSDINASAGVGGIDGTVAINRLDIDPNQGLVVLPAELVDASNQIAAGCASDAEVIARNEFIITGRGGLPPSPTEPLSGEAVLTRWATLEPEVEGSSAAPATRVAALNQIVEANGWAIAPNGQVILTASAPNPPNSSALTPAACNDSYTSAKY